MIKLKIKSKLLLYVVRSEIIWNCSVSGVPEIWGLNVRRGGSSNNSIKGVGVDFKEEVLEHRSICWLGRVVDVRGSVGHFGRVHSLGKSVLACLLKLLPSLLD